MGGQRERRVSEPGLDPWNKEGKEADAERRMIRERRNDERRRGESSAGRKNPDLEGEIGLLSLVFEKEGKIEYRAEWKSNLEHANGSKRR